jgi:putative endopeptidase
MGIRLPAMGMMVAVLAISADTASQRPEDLGLTTEVRPQDDLYGHVNAGWLARTPIPPDRVDYNAFAEATEVVEARVLALIQDLGTRRGGTARQVADLYASVTDEAPLIARGLAPIRDQLDQIDRIRTPRDLAIQAGILTSTAAGGPFAGAMATDPLDAAKLTVRYTQGGTLLDRDRYLEADARSDMVRAKYTEYLATIFRLVGRPEPDAEARDLLALETRLARLQWTAVESRDPSRANVRYTLRQLGREMPGFDWDAWARPQGIDGLGGIVLAQPSFFKAFAALVPGTPIETWRAWLRARHVTAMAPYLPDPFSDARFEFFGRFLTGQETPRPRWRRGVALVSSHLADLIGRPYVERHLSRASKAGAQAVAAQVRAAFREAIAEARWLSPAARRDALYKLSRLRIRIGQPDAWRDYRGLAIRSDDLLGNIQRARRFEHQQQLARAAGHHDPRYWPVPAHSAAAVTSPATGEVFVPAGALQPPFFDPDGDDALNYGALGAIIGHELNHAFDARGRHIDGDGEVRDWWTSADEQAFAAIAARLIEEAGNWSFRTPPSFDATFTLAENAADLAGLSVAYRAYRQSLGGRPSPVVDGLTGEQRFFIAWARTWRSKTRPEYARQARLTDPHAPGVFRVNGIVQHLDGFHEAFGVKPGDRLHRAPEARVRLW